MSLPCYSASQKFGTQFRIQWFFFIRIIFYITDKYRRHENYEITHTVRNQIERKKSLNKAKCVLYFRFFKVDLTALHTATFTR